MPRQFGIHYVHIADGFADDCDELVHRCMKVENLNYQVFCSIWKQMNMGSLYEGRTLGAEIAELSEEVIHIAKHYMLKNTDNFEESVTGLFIVYALLNLQPYPGFAHLRLVPEDVPAIDRLELVARREKRHDVLYVLAAVLIRGPVQYHAAEREHGMGLAIRKYLEGYTSIDRLGVRPKGVFYRQNEELDIIRELNSITERYTLAKMAISETVEFDRNLKYINESLPNELQSSLKKIISGIYEDQSVHMDKDNNSDEDKILKSRQAIKTRAMKQDVDPVKFLVNAEDRKQKATKVPKPKKQAPKANKKATARKDLEITKPACEVGTKLRKMRKRRIPISPRAIKRSRTNNDTDRKESSSESEESDESDEHDEEVDDTDDSEDSDNSDDNVNGEKHDKEGNNLECIPIDVLEKSDIVTNNEDSVNFEDDKTQDGDVELIGKDNEQELDIKIDTLPVFIRTEDQGKLYEIEIIDSLKDSATEPVQEQRTYGKGLNALKKIRLMPGMSIKKIDTAQNVQEPRIRLVSGSDGTTVDMVDDLANITEITDDGESSYQLNDILCDKWPNIPRLERRQMKRVHLQSKFKKLGMLPIANFDDSLVTTEETDVEPTELASNSDIGVIED